jgi:UDP-glucose 4-epimerase
MNDRPAILVTGGAGYIGSHACRALEAAGYQPIVYDNLSTGHRHFVRGPLVIGDLLDARTLARIFGQHDIKAVMHSPLHLSSASPWPIRTNIISTM